MTPHVPPRALLTLLGNCLLHVVVVTAFRRSRWPDSCLVVSRSRQGTGQGPQGLLCLELLKLPNEARVAAGG